MREREDSNHPHNFLQFLDGPSPAANATHDGTESADVPSNDGDGGKIEGGTGQKGEVAGNPAFDSRGKVGKGC